MTVLLPHVFLVVGEVSCGCLSFVHPKHAYGRKHTHTTHTTHTRARTHARTGFYLAILVWRGNMADNKGTALFYVQ